MCVRNEIILAKYFYPSNNSNDTLVSARIFLAKWQWHGARGWVKAHKNVNEDEEKSEMKGKKVFLLGIFILSQQLKWNFLSILASLFNFLYLNGNQWSKMFCVNRENKEENGYERCDKERRCVYNVMQRKKRWGWI